MSLGDDGYRSGQGSGGDGGGYGGYDADDHHLTRTRLPEGEVDPYAPQRRPVRPSRNLITIVAVVVLLVAAIAFANRGGDKSSHGDDENSAKGGSSATAPSGVKPVEEKNGGIPSGFAHDEQGVQSAAANFAVALNSTDMYKSDSRLRILDAVYTPDVAEKRRGPLDKLYADEAFLKRIGLDSNANPPKGMTFISRANPVGTRIVKYEGDRASVAVWYSALFGIAGEGSKTPVAESWYTNTFEFSWTGKDWKITDFTQKDGPAPVGRDQTASSAEEMSDAVKGFGGLTYAR
ncbi:hypothetical protein J7W19_18315 [Streptomyces mobaraensis NBRC 13819 = DSM 40847]|uniref:Putative integral membrane protein n=1 Tax=Streptomyces mobaraensis (strain ATCC 29032 / DSM 40847 / JCM 4168 / NBRC 13819 / NCIMB 11159 / IPCR 16-22) TaxID=1223523 RepID=M2ZV59_STRM1|nr:hypothetical protein [Streptomyces mobaraensis]EME96618.1 putative integral membrane protein [Streptomyces mobaraensis NBRC 13819 = DSM 40847]QTT75072.1 hypothetical protein J7W19_18315 [Streptomyces mobaraensis NBRC 13819 = DSM 40847]